MYLKFGDWLSSWHYFMKGRTYLYGGFVSSRNPLLEAITRRECDRVGRLLSILEIGSYRGNSALLFEQYGYVVAVDLWDSASVRLRDSELHGSQLSRRIFERNLKIAGLGRIFPIQGNSLEVLRILQGAQFDMVYVDGGHDYETCRADILLSWPMVRPGGVILIDDYETCSYPTVIQAVNELFPPPVESEDGLAWVRK